MSFEIEKYDSMKHKEDLYKYLCQLEKNFEYIPFIFSVEFIEILSQFKDFFVILEKKKIINVGYENKLKKHVGFLFENPKKSYDFLKSAKSVAVLFLPKNGEYKEGCEKLISFEEIIVRSRNSINLSRIGSNKLRKKINKLKRYSPEIIFDIFSKDSVSKKELEDFYNSWETLTKKRKSPYMFLYHNYVRFLYEKGGSLGGIFAKYDGKIIGISFFIKSPSGNQAIGLSSNGLHSFKGLNETLLYERYKLLWKNNKVNFVNTGPCGPGEVIKIKEKFDSFRETFYIAIIKGSNLEKDSFWYNDCLDPDDFNMGQYD